LIRYYTIHEIKKWGTYEKDSSAFRFNFPFYTNLFARADFNQRPNWKRRVWCSVVKSAVINNSFALFVGGYVGWLINHTFLLGGGGYGLANSISAPGNALDYYGAANDLKIQLGYGGLLLEYLGNPDALIHYNESALIGGGGVNYGYLNMDSYYGDHFGNSSFFVLEPEAGA